MYTVRLSEAYLLVGQIAKASTLAGRRLHLLVIARNGALRRGRSGSVVKSPRRVILRRLSRPRPIISKPLPWPRNSACAHCRRTVTTVSGHCIVRQAVQHCPCRALHRY